MKKILHLILILSLCLIFNVKADLDTNAGEGGGISGENLGCDGKDSCFLNSYYGLRISLYVAGKNEMGVPNQVGKTVDFITKPPANYLIFSGSRTKYQVIASGGNTNLVQGSSSPLTISMDNPYKKGGSTGIIISVIEKEILGGMTKEEYNDIGYHIDPVTKKRVLKPGWDNEKINTKKLEQIRPFFEKFGYTLETEVFNGSLDLDLYIVAEPLAVIRDQESKSNKNKMIMGTGTELGKYMQDNSLSWASTAIKKASSTPGGTVSLTLTTPRSMIGITGVGDNPQAPRDLAAHFAPTGYSIGIWKLSEILPGSQCPTSCKTNCTEECKEINCCKTTPSPEPGKCCDLGTLELITKIVKDCKEGTQGYVKDISDWCCIFESRNSSNQTVKNHFYTGVENRYCSIFCREEVYYDYPSSNLTVKAGNHFSVGITGSPITLIPVKFTGRSECRVTSGTAGGVQGKINYEQFEKDWVSANVAVKEKWDALQIEIAKSDSIANATTSTTPNCANYCDYNDHNVPCCIEAEPNMVKCVPGVNNCPDEPDAYIQVGYKCKIGKGVNPYPHGYSNTPIPQTYNGKQYTAGSWCTDCGNTFSPTTCTSNTNVASAQSAYNSALQTRNNYLTQLVNCNNFQRTYKEFAPELQFKYDEGQYERLNYNYSYSDILDNNTYISAQTSYFKGSSSSGVKFWSTSSYLNSPNKIIYDTSLLLGGAMNRTTYSGNRSSRPSSTISINKDNANANYNAGKIYGSSNTIMTYYCNSFGITCETGNITYPTNDWLKMYTTKEMDYKLKDGVYNYVYKDTGQSVFTPTRLNYYVIGYSNLPTHYARKTRNDYTFSLDFSSKIFGNDQKFYKYLKGQAKIDTAIGNEAELTIYDKIWKTANINNMINDSKQGNNYLNENFVPAINGVGITTQQFLDTSCAKQYDCKLVSGNRIYCSKDIKCSTCSTSNTSCCNQNYQGLRACIESQAANVNNTNPFVNTNYTYTCTYRIENEYVCPPDENCKYIGLSAIYRTIDLNNPFPDRESGFNWNDTTIENYITNNRNVKTDSIYANKDPLYTIELTPTLIDKIKRYNKSHDMSDYEMICDSNGRNCLSKFIRQEFASVFKGCGINGKQTTRCNSNEAW